MDDRPIIAGAATAPLHSMIGDERHRYAWPIGVGGYMTRPYDRWLAMDFMDVIAGAAAAPLRRDGIDVRSRVASPLHRCRIDGTAVIAVTSM